MKNAGVVGLSKHPGKRLVLASDSSRRRDLLAQIGVVPDDIQPPDIDETPFAREPPHIYASRMAFDQTSSVSSRLSEPSYILGADTVVCLGKRLLLKAKEKDTARLCLKQLSGRRHTVFTAICLVHTGVERPLSQRLVKSNVTFSRMTNDQIEHLLAKGDWFDKAGGYTIQGQAASFIRFISGSPSSVIGLPLFETAQILRGQGLIP